MPNEPPEEYWAGRPQFDVIKHLLKEVEELKELKLLREFIEYKHYIDHEEFETFKKNYNKLKG